MLFLLANPFWKVMIIFTSFAHRKRLNNCDSLLHRNPVFYALRIALIRLLDHFPSVFSAISNNKRISAKALGCNYLTNDPRRRFPISLHHDDVRGYFVLFACRIAFAFARNRVIPGMKFRSLKKNSRDTLTSHELSTRFIPNYTSVLIHIIIFIPHFSANSIILFMKLFLLWDRRNIFYCTNIMCNMLLNT